MNSISKDTGPRSQNESKSFKGHILVVFQARGFKFLTKYLESYEHSENNIFIYNL